MRRFCQMTADEIASYRGPRYCCTATWSPYWVKSPIMSDLEEPSEEALVEAKQFVRAVDPLAVFTPTTIHQTGGQP